MTREELVALHERAVAAWRAHDAVAVAGCYTPDAVHLDSGNPQSVHGREAIEARAGMFMTAFPDLGFETRSLSIDENRVVAEVALKGTHDGDLMGIPPTGRRAQARACSVAHVGDDGLIARETTYWDYASLLRQLGVLPEPARAAGGSG